MADEREHGPTPQGQDDQKSVLERVQSMLGGAESNTERSLDDDCDNCGKSEGSVITSKEDGWALCRDCYNDPEVLEEYV